MWSLYNVRLLIATLATSFGWTHHLQRCQPLEIWNLETVYFAVPPTSNTAVPITANRPSDPKLWHGFGSGHYPKSHINYRLWKLTKWSWQLVTKILCSKMPQKASVDWKKLFWILEELYKSKLKHWKAQNSILPRKFGDPYERPGDLCCIKNAGDLAYKPTDFHWFNFFLLGFILSCL